MVLLHSLMWGTVLIKLTTCRLVLLWQWRFLLGNGDEALFYFANRNRVLVSCLQAIEHRQLGLVAAAFYEPGELLLSSGNRLRVDQPCLVLVTEADSGGTLTAANPRNTAMILRVELSGPKMTGKLVVVE